MTTVELSNLSAGYDATPVLRQLTLQVTAGELLALLGPSGGGKTTVLKLIAGLLAPATGEITFNGQSILRQPAEKRDVAVVFQKPLLFPYLTVAENVGFGLKMRGLPQPTLRQRVDEALRMVQLVGFEHRKPHELSGGQEQRAALARALVIEPRVLLLDEPFSALDEALRSEMRELLRELQRRLRLTTLFVTHDQAEAASLADRIALLSNGRLEQVGAPRDFYLTPQTPHAARFFGWQVVTGQMHGGQLETALGRFPLPAGAATTGQLAFHPDRLSFSEQGELAGVIETVVDLGMTVRYRVRLVNGEAIELAEAAGQTIRRTGEQVKLRLPVEAISFFPNS
jgi:putative spermidine/putrescine transport system ATP-binding protein